MTTPVTQQARPPRFGRSVLRPGDVLRTGLAGLRSRRTRAALSALGIAIGIAALVAVLGITRSSQSALLAEIDQLGTNLLTVTNGQTLSGQEAELPVPATAMIRRVAGVERAAPTAILASARVYRTDKVPVFDTGGLAARAADPSLLAVLGGTLRQGAFLNQATSRYPVTVLGHQAAQSLGIASVDPGGTPPRVLIGGQWFTVAGIRTRCRSRRRSTAPRWSASRSPPRCSATTATQAGSTSAPTSPRPHGSPPSSARRPTRRARRRGGQPALGRADRAARGGRGVHRLFLGLGAVALLVGGIGIANVMVIAVLERRAEIGLRRALGAARRHIAAQFLTEAVLLGLLGGAAGAACGAVITEALARAGTGRR